MHATYKSGCSLSLTKSANQIVSMLYHYESKEGDAAVSQYKFNIHLLFIHHTCLVDYLRIQPSLCHMHHAHRITWHFSMLESLSRAVGKNI